MLIDSERVRQAAHRAARRTRHGASAARRHWKLLLLWGGSLGFIVVGLVVLWAATLQIPDLSALENRRIDQSVQIYDRTGQVLLYDLNQNVDRTVVPLASISPNVQAATIAIEDPGFYQHGGIQPSAILRAIFVDVTTLGLNQGGSTLTQQVVKNTLLTNDKSIARKLKEWILAIKLEQQLTKDQILELYLNQAPYGGPIYGVEAAAEAFFGVSSQNVSVEQAAYLAAVLPAPTYYSPYGNHRADLDARKNLVLDKMYEHGYITAAQRDEAKSAEVAFLPQRKNSIQAPHFVFYVEQYLEDKYGKDALDAGGWKVTTTLDVDLQAHAEESVTKWGDYNAKNLGASNAALVALDPTNGQILAMVGSRDYFSDAIQGSYNDTLAERQPGSAFKPFAYAEAFEKGYTPDTVVFDVPTQFSTACAASDFSNKPPCYSPVNYDDKFVGPISLRDAIAQSRNVPSVKTLYLAGLEDTLALAKSMGLTTLGSAGQYGLTLVLGGGEVNLLEMTSAYGAFAQDGIHHPSQAVLKIEDSTGHIIEDNSEVSGTQVLPAQVAQEINDVLSDPVARAPLGENTLLSFPGHDVAVKTGTTNNYRDAWTIGYTPNLVVGVWAGNNDNTPMVKKVSGFIVGPMWHDFVAYALQKIPSESFTRTEIDESGLKPILRGQWQVPGSDGRIHEILYWVDKNDPLGPPPSNPNSDSQFHLWDPPVTARYGVPSYNPGPQVPQIPQPQVQYDQNGQPFYTLPPPQPEPQQQPTVQAPQPTYSQTGGAILPQ
jgi:1A family penicillin-binding protein